MMMHQNILIMIFRFPKDNSRWNYDIIKQGDHEIFVEDLVSSTTSSQLSGIDKLMQYSSGILNDNHRITLPYLLQ